MRIFGIFIIILLFPVFMTGEENVSFTNDNILHVVQNNLPPDWKIVEKTTDKIPHGHYWGFEYNGRKGQEIVIQGPADVNFCWSDKNGKNHYIVLAKESLELWIMPPEYGETWKKYFMLHRPISAELIASGRAGRVYAFQTHRLTNKNEFH